MVQYLDPKMINLHFFSQNHNIYFHYGESINERLHCSVPEPFFDDKCCARGAPLMLVARGDAITPCQFNFS